MTDTVTVTISLPINGTPLERAQAVVGAIYVNGGSLAGMALGQLLGDLRPYVEPAAAGLGSAGDSLLRQGLSPWRSP